MIVSYHPCFRGDKNILCAGRLPDSKDEKQIKKAKAVILPQGCPKQLYIMAKENCKNVFPNLYTKFKYPGKIGQAKLFAITKTFFPETFTFLSIKDIDTFNPPLKYPFVFKFDWGGECENVFWADSQKTFVDLMRKAEYNERNKRSGFILQRYIDCGNRSLRVAVIGKRLFSYWRVNDTDFRAGVGVGGHIDKDFDIKLQNAAKAEVKKFCEKTKIDLAGFDILFDKGANDPVPIFLEINYFFGRKGLGGSENYYKILKSEIEKWLIEKGV